MTALAQCSGGMALIVSFALLGTRQVNAAAMLLTLQSAAVAVPAVAMHRPVTGAVPMLLSAGIWFTRRRACGWAPESAIIGATPGMVGAFILTALCQPQGMLAVPLAIVLLSTLLGAMRRHHLMHVVALAGIANGVALATCLAPPATNLQTVSFPALLPLCCLLLPVPLALPLLIPGVTRYGTRGQYLSGRVIARLGGAAGWLRWVDLAAALAVLAATMVVQSDAIAAVFAPVLGLDGVLRSWRRRARSLRRRVLALLGTSLPLLAVWAQEPLAAWLAILAAVAVSLLPVLARRWDSAVVALHGAGIALFGLTLISSAPFVVGYFSVFAGFVMIASAVPDLAVVLAIIILRIAGRTLWPPMVQAVGLGVALAAVLACAAALTLSHAGGKSRASRLTGGSPVVLLELFQVSVAALALSLGQPNGRFAGIVLLILLILMRAAAKGATGPVAGLAVAGLGGVPPSGVFPGLVLVALALAEYDSWLLLPLGLASVPVLMASLPLRLPSLLPALAVPSINWLPWLLAAVVGFFAPDAFVRWCHALSAAP